MKIFLYVAYGMTSIQKTMRIVVMGGEVANKCMKLRYTNTICNLQNLLYYLP